MNRSVPNLSALLMCCVLGLVAVLLIACTHTGSGHYTAKAVDRSPVASEPAGPASPVDELWVIAKPEGVSFDRHGDAPVARAFHGPADTADPPVGHGAMLAMNEQQQVPLPLKHTDVRANVSAYIATVDVTQQFQNPFDEKIEAVYVFPLPQNAAVNEFVMTIGERRILFTGDIEEQAIANILGDERIRADVLVLPHHGQVVPSTPELLAATGADVLIRSTNRRRADTTSGLFDLAGDRPLLSTADVGAVCVTLSGAEARATPCLAE